jgi:hypothetical protein
MVKHENEADKRTKIKTKKKVIAPPQSAQLRKRLSETSLRESETARKAQGTQLRACGCDQRKSLV